MEEFRIVSLSDWAFLPPNFKIVNQTVVRGDCGAVKLCYQRLFSFLKNKKVIDNMMRRLCLIRSLSTMTFGKKQSFLRIYSNN